MPFTYNTSVTTPNRWHGGNTRESITIHHWGNPSSYSRDPSSVIRWLSSRSAGASAHFVATDNRVDCLAACSDRTWSTGSRAGNNSTIAIECQPDMSAATFETVAELIANLYNWYPHLKTRRLLPHSAWVPTVCPGKYRSNLERLRLRALELVPVVNPDAPGQSRKAKPVGKYPKNPKTASHSILVPDGWLGFATVKAWQLANKTPVDGVISSQPEANRQLLRGVTSVVFVPNSQAIGSRLIARVQQTLHRRRLYTGKIDGILGPATIRALQKLYGTHVDGVIDGPSPMVRKLQDALNTQLAGV